MMGERDITWPRLSFNTCNWQLEEVGVSDDCDD